MQKFKRIELVDMGPKNKTGRYRILIDGHWCNSRDSMERAKSIYLQLIEDWNKLYSYPKTVIKAEEIEGTMQSFD